MWTGIPLQLALHNIAYRPPAIPAQLVIRITIRRFTQMLSVIFSSGNLVIIFLFSQFGAGLLITKRSELLPRPSLISAWRNTALSASSGSTLPSGLSRTSPGSLREDSPLESTPPTGPRPASISWSTASATFSLWRIRGNWTRSGVLRVIFPT